ncbi:MAG: phosphocholine cytidylyltransferase family protein [Rhodospirillales bacterium]|jgi:choline kinase|nr:phosphocholine cytidylyltransferase family protein [Rhodospirillales bacterium]MBT4626126.1 phosphocholine cytidylyltransferase family protein [Rhodospirillales bacterium]MBT5522266.1 phosphocholine cytidylyltransferase family protein [Rhodospirillales bacterium]MBT6109385.1 phosphocholine cytidylyltransferase family protein [Rhodospirillales bacterium]
MQQEIKGLILAAGRGSRLGSMTEAQPKGMVTLGGRSLIEWQLSSLRAAGVKDIAIITGYRSDVLDVWGLPTFHNERWADTNMVMSLTAASEWLETKTCIVSYADIFYAHSDVTNLIELDSNIGVAYDPHWRTLWEQRFDDPHADAESFSLDGNRISDIGRPTKAGDKIDGQYLGLIKVAPEGWRSIATLIDSHEPSQRDRIDMTTLLRLLIESGQDVYGSEVENEWGEVDHPSDLAFYEQRLATGAYPWAHDIGLA